MKLATLMTMTALLALLVGCDLLDKNPAEVKTQVGKLQSAVAGSDWNAVQNTMDGDFAWTDANGKTHKGKSPFVTSLKAGGGGGATFTVSKVVKVTGATYLALTSAKVGSMSWNLRLTWTKKSAGWMLTEAKDLSARQGGSAPATAGKSSSTPTSAAGQMAKETGEAVDYAIGYTQLKAKKKVKEQVNDINDKHNQDLENALK